MKIMEYFQITVPKIGPAAFDIARDARIQALENMLVEKGLCTKDELEAEYETLLGDNAKKISEMPTKQPNEVPPKQSSN